jgi:hypothetical protein
MRLNQQNLDAIYEEEPSLSGNDFPFLLAGSGSEMFGIDSAEMRWILEACVIGHLSNIEICRSQKFLRLDQSQISDKLMNTDVGNRRELAVKL